ncbi:MAG: winged helix-turn-helix domain-containing protein [Candidatus Krumholzibacteriales bacterium]
MNEKKKTVEEMKKKREVPAGLREKVKDFNRVRKLIMEELKEEPRTIPEIAEGCGLKASTVTYHLMSLMKYGQVEVDRMDDMDEYYYYRAGREQDG